MYVQQQQKKSKSYKNNFEARINFVVIKDNPSLNTRMHYNRTFSDIHTQIEIMRVLKEIF